MGKVITSEQMLRLLPVPAAAQEQLAHSFCFRSDSDFTPQQLNHLAAEGFVECKQIDYGVPQYVIWYHFTVDGGLHVNAALQLNETPLFEALSLALDVIARSQGAKFIRWTTHRPGLVHKAETYGYSADSVVMVKRL